VFEVKLDLRFDLAKVARRSGRTPR